MKRSLDRYLSGEEKSRKELALKRKINNFILDCLSFFGYLLYLHDQKAAALEREKDRELALLEEEEDLRQLGWLKPGQTLKELIQEAEQS